MRTFSPIKNFIWYLETQYCIITPLPYTKHSSIVFYFLCTHLLFSSSIFSPHCSLLLTNFTLISYYVSPTSFLIEYSLPSPSLYNLFVLNNHAIFTNVSLLSHPANRFYYKRRKLLLYGLIIY